MIPWITALVGLFLGYTAGNMLIPGMIGAPSGIHTLSALISSLMVSVFAIGVATFGYLAAKRIEGIV